MPIYEYLCRACGRETERLQKLSDNPLTDCPDCGQPALVRKISAPSFRLKGGGWYETDFKSDKEKKRNLAGDAETRPDGAAKAEAKPAPAAAKPAAAGKTESA
jgi:putative FmdB family regulatory protein